MLLILYHKCYYLYIILVEIRNVRLIEKQKLHFFLMNGGNTSSWRGCAASSHGTSHRYGMG